MHLSDTPRLLRHLAPLLGALERFVWEGAGSDSAPDARGGALSGLHEAVRSVPEDLRDMKPDIPWGELEPGGQGGGAQGPPVDAARQAIRSILAELGLDEGTLVYCGEAERSYAIVIDTRIEGRDARLLFLDGVLSSGEHADGSPALCYPPAVMRSFELLDSPRRALIIGIAGGTMVGIVRRSFPGIEIDCVDIDSRAVEIGKRFFSLREGGRTRIHITDGRDFVRGAPGPYDLVVMDAFAGLSPVPHLSSVEFAREIKSRLSPGAVCAVNVIARVERAGYLQHAYGTWRSAFSDVIALPLCAEGDTFNVVLIATDRDTSAFRRANSEAVFEMEFDPAQVFTDSDSRIRELSPY